MPFGQIKSASAKRLDIAYQTHLLIAQSLTSVHLSGCKWQRVTALPCGHGGQAARLALGQGMGISSLSLQQIRAS